MNLKSLGLLLAGLLLGGLVGWLVLTVSGQSPVPSSPGLRSSGAGENPIPNEFVPRAGSPAPDFALKSITGETVTRSDYLGKPVLLNFWATWCGPCRIEMPAIQNEFDRHSPNLAVLAVNFDEPEEEVRTFAEELGLTFDVLLDPGGKVNEELFRVRGYPTSILVDEKGMIQVVQIGIMTEGQLEEYLSRVGLER